MTLKAKVDKIDDVEEGYRPLYEEKDGAWVLKPIDGMKPLDEFNVVHRALGKERDEHRVTKDSLANANKTITGHETSIADLTATLEGKGVKIDEKLIDQRVQQRVAPLQRELEDTKSKLTAANQDIEGFKARDTKSTIERAIQKAAGGAHVRDTAIDDAVLLGQNIFEVVDGKVVSKADVQGVTPGVGPDVWLSGLRNNKVHWFKESSGGGAGGGGGGGGTANPWTKANWNLTEQGKLVRENAEKAAQFAKAAGSFVGASKPPEK